MVTMGMVIVAGQLLVDPEQREAYLATCDLDLAHRQLDALRTLGADLVDPARINIFERWESQDAVEAFRGDGVDDEQGSMIRGASVAEYGAVEERVLA